MIDKFCRAGKIECELSRYNGTYCMARHDDFGWVNIEGELKCIEPSRQQPIIPTEQVAAEIADMPIDEFEANFEKLKKLSLRTYANPKIGEAIILSYKLGAAEQSRRDIEAVETYANGSSVLKLSVIRTALKTAAIKED